MLETDKAAYFVGETVTIVPPTTKAFSIQKVVNVYTAPIGMGDKDLVWTKVAQMMMSKGTTFKAPTETGMFAIGIDDEGTPAIKRIIRVIETPPTILARIGNIPIGVAALGVVAIGAVATIAYKKFKKPK